MGSAQTEPPPLPPMLAAVEEGSESGEGGLGMPRIYAAINRASQLHGERIRKTRLGLGMTQTELAKLFGVWRETISRIECGYFDITRAYPRYQILNERMRIWAEMNKGGRKRKYRKSRTKTRKNKKLGTAQPRVSSRSRYWESVNQAKKENQNAREHAE
jgi:DNA-binding XRE family transcriptional regulator